MKTLTSSILLAMTLIGANAYAEYPGPLSLQSNTTRAQVRADLAQARAAGQVYDDAHYPGPFPQTSNVTREQVRAELAQAKAEGWAFNDATYPVPAHKQPRQQAKPRNAQLASSGVGAPLLP